MRTSTRLSRRLWRLLAIILALTLVAAACGDDDDDVASDDGAAADDDGAADDGAADDGAAADDDGAAADDDGAADDGAAADDDGAADDGAADDGAAGEYPPGVDVNEDGQITIGYAVAGDRDDGGFYQGQVEAVEGIAQENGWETIIVDQVNPGAARETFENLARQGVDLIIGGGSELRDGFIPVSEDPTFADINFFLVAGFPPTTDTYATAAANENEAHFMGGAATGLLLERSGGDVGCITAGPELDFVQNMAAAMQAGLEHLNENYGMAEGAEMLVTFTGDFEDASLAQEAATAQINQDCEVIYPYLGGALVAVWNTAAEAGVGVAATSLDLCGVPDFPADIVLSILYNPSLYLGDIINQFVAGELTEGEQLAVYGVGSGVGVGAEICDPTPEEQQILDEIREAIASGEINVNEIIGTEVSG